MVAESSASRAQKHVWRSPGHTWRRAELDAQRWQRHRRQSASIKERGRSTKHSLVACCGKIKKRIENSRQGRLRDASSNRRRHSSDRPPRAEGATVSVKYHAIYIFLRK